MPLPGVNTVKAVGQVSKERVQSISNELAMKANPKRILSSGFSAVQNSIFSELPELGNLSGMLGSFIRDVKNTKTTEKSEKNLEDTAENTFKTVKNTEKLTDVYDIMDLIYAEIRTLTQITAKVWDANLEETELLRKTYANDIKESKLRRLEEQKDDAQSLASKKIETPTQQEKSKKSFFDKLKDLFFVPLLAAFSLLKNAILGIGAAFAASKLGSILIPEAIRSKIISENKKNNKRTQAKNQPRNALGQFTKIDEPEKENLDNKKPKDKFAKIGKAGSMLGKIGSVGFRFLGPVALLWGAYNAITSGIEGFAEELRKSGNLIKSIGMGIFETFNSFLLGAPQFLVDKWKEFKIGEKLGTLWDKIFTPIKNVFNFYVDVWTKIFKTAMSFGEKLGNFVTDLKDSVIDHLTKSKDLFINGLKSMLNDIVDKFKMRKLLPESVQEFLRPSSNNENMLSNLEQRKPPIDTAMSMLNSKQTISEMDKQYKNAMIQNMVGDNRKESGSNVNISSNNTTVLPSNIFTRNPDSPLFNRSLITP